MGKGTAVIYEGLPRKKYKIFVPSSSVPFPEFTEALFLLELQPYATETLPEHSLTGAVLSEVAREFSVPVYYSDPFQGFIASKTSEALNNWLESFQLFTQIIPDRRPVVIRIDYTKGQGGKEAFSGKSIVLIVEEGKTPRDYSREEEPEFIEIYIESQPALTKIRRAVLPNIPGEMDGGWHYIDHTFRGADTVFGLSSILRDIFNAEYAALSENRVALGILPANTSATPTTVGYFPKDRKVALEKYYIPRGDRPEIFFNHPGEGAVEASATPHELIVDASKKILKVLKRPVETHISGTVYKKVKLTPLEILSGENRGKKADAWYTLLNEPQAPWRYLGLFSQEGSLIFLPDLPPGTAVYISGESKEPVLVDIREDLVAFSTPYTVLGVYTEALQRSAFYGKEEIEKKGIGFALPNRPAKPERIEKYLNTLFFGHSDQYIEATRIPGVTIPFTKEEYYSVLAEFSPAELIAKRLIDENSGSVRKAAKKFVEIAKYRPEGKNYYLVKIRGAAHLIKELTFAASVYSKKFLELSKVFYKVVDAKSRDTKEAFYFEVPYNVPDSDLNAFTIELPISGATWTLVSAGRPFRTVEFSKDGTRVGVYPRALPLWHAWRIRPEEDSKVAIYSLPFTLRSTQEFWEEVYRAAKKHPEVKGFSVEVVYVTPVTVAEIR